MAIGGVGIAHRTVAFLVCGLFINWPVIAQTLPDPDLTNPCDPLEGDCDPSPPGDPTQYLDPLSDAVSAMHDDLLANWFQSGVCGQVEQSEPVVTQVGDFLSASGSFAIFSLVDAAYLGIGTTEVTANLNTPGVDVLMETTDEDPVTPSGPSRRWTLTMTVSVSQGTVYMWGTLDYIRFIPLETATYTGGWTYSPTTGPLENPASDPGFHSEVENIFGCQTTVAGAHSIGSILSLVGNGIGMWLNYLRDLYRPYTAPSTCLGPSIANGSGQSCDGVDIPCADDLSEVSTYLDDLTGVSTQFKKCLKGRLGCGGSSFPRLRITCADSDSCGPCSYTDAAGCNIGGTAIWYCSPTANPCQCANTVFHEAAHSCGALDLENGANNDSYRIGDWFQEEMADQLGCQPGSSSIPSSTVDTGTE